MDEELPDVPQGEIVKMLNLSGNSIKKLRDNHLTSEDWYRETKEERKGLRGPPRVMFRPTGVAKLRVVNAAASIAPLAVPRFCDSIVIGQAINRKYVRCKVKLPTGEWVRGHVLKPPKLRNFLRTGKKIRVQLVEDKDGNRSFRHETLCP
mgnify:CR=1 FL=1